MFPRVLRYNGFWSIWAPAFDVPFFRHRFGGDSQRT